MTSPSVPVASMSSLSIMDTDAKNDLIFLTWNIDGLHSDNLSIRTEAVCKQINDTKADVVFLQEVVSASEAIIRSRMEPEYNVFTGQLWKGIPAKYYTVILTRKSTVSLESKKTLDYDNSRMNRNMLTAKVQVNGVRINMINTHLESTAGFQIERMAQFDRCLKFANECPEHEPVIIAGDLNMRDRELQAAGGIPPGFYDVWEATGSRQEWEYTWDMGRNDSIPDIQKLARIPRCRFDRIIIRETKPVGILTPSDFRLIGFQRLQPSFCFASDHWGLKSIFRTKIQP